MKSSFRSVDFWQSALLTLPDTAFFDLLRSILGVVKTPFNKQKLVEELSRFIVNPEIQKTITAYINDNDRRIIAAIALLAEPVPGELESFFTGEYSYAELQEILLNLEERLIIYRFRDNGILRIALNPRLENILAPHTANTQILFPAIEKSKMEKSKAAINNTETLNGRTLAALFAFLLNNELQFKDNDDGKNISFSFKKKAAEQSKILFPGLDINVLAGGLLTLGLFNDEENKSSSYLVPNEGKISAFKVLPERDRLEYLAAAAALFLSQGGLSASYKNRSLLRNAVSLIHGLCNTAKDGRTLPETTLIKLAELLRRQEENSWGFMGELPSASILLRSLVIVGLFVNTEMDGVRCLCPLFINSDTKNNKGDTAAKTADKPCIAMDSGFSCILYPEINFADALDLSAFSFIEETGTTVRFTLSRDSVVRGFNRSYNAEQIWKLLDRLSGSRLPDSLKWNLDDWEKRWKEVSLDEGVILTLTPEREYLAQTEALSSIIKCSLAPGLYLLSAELGDAAAILHNAGVDIVARPALKAEASSSYFTPLSKTTGSGDTGIIMNKFTAEKLDTGQPSENAEQIKDTFRSALEKMKLSKQEREELESRIERRTIVSETQLKDTASRYEKLEARSLDYAGKASIVKQAISTGSLLEISCLNGDKILGMPETLDKKGTEMVLVIKPRANEDTALSAAPDPPEEPVRIALGKISLLRRIKPSIFGV